MRLLTLLLIICACMLGHVGASDVEQLVETLKKAATTGAGISSEEQEISTKVQSFGAEAIPYLLPLLGDNNKEVRALASYTLRDIDGLTEQHLDALIESCRRGDGWIPPAIARIGTPKAVEFLVEELVRQRRTESQLTYAIEMLGQKAVAELVKIYEKNKGWDAELERTLNYVFKELGNKASGAVEPLLRIADDESASRAKRTRAIDALGSIGLSAQNAVPHLQKLQKHGNAEIRDSAETAILNIGSAGAVPILVTMLEAEPRLITLRDIAALKSHGRSAAPVLVKFLFNDDWDLRLGATRALGYVGYVEAGDPLIGLLNCREDWRVVLSAAESLGKLKVERAIPALSQVFTNHWYPPVREAAMLAVKTIRDGTPVESRYSDDDFPFEFSDYEHAGRKMESLTEEDVRSLSFPAAQTPDQPVTVPMKGKNGFLKRETRRGVEVQNGYLVASDRGEWGGAITFIDRIGNSRVIVRENTEAIYKTSHGIIAVTGYAHLTFNRGLVYKITRSDGKWTAEKWRALPGAPRFSRLLEDGNLLVSCYGGIVSISASGEMKSLKRSESLFKDAPRK